MKTPYSILVFILLCLIAACSRRSASIPGCIRFTETDSVSYRLEAGTMAEGAFIPSSSEQYPYSLNLHRRAELEPVFGKTLIALALWSSLPSSAGYRRSTESWVVNGVPYVAIEPR